MSWRPDEIELREKLLDEVSYVLGELPSSQKVIEVTVRVLTTLEDLGWAKKLATMTATEAIAAGVIQHAGFSVEGDEEGR